MKIRSSALAAFALLAAAVASRGEATPIFTETFATASGKWSSTGGAAYDNPGWTASGSVYRGEGGVRIGSSSASATLTSPLIAISDPGNASTISVTIQAAAYVNKKGGLFLKAVDENGDDIAGASWTKALKSHSSSDAVALDDDDPELWFSDMTFSATSSFKLVFTTSLTTPNDVLRVLVGYVGVAEEVSSGGGDGPSGPEALAAPTDLVASQIGDSGFALSWTGDANAYDYEVKVLDGDGTAAGSVSASGTSATVTGLSSDTTYTVRVKALAASGSEEYSDSGWSEQIPVTTALAGGLVRATLFEENFSKISTTSWTSSSYSGTKTGDAGTWTGIDLASAKSAIIVGRANKGCSVDSPEIVLANNAVCGTVKISFAAAAYNNDKDSSLALSFVDSDSGVTNLVQTYSSIDKLDSSATTVADAGFNPSETVQVPEKFVLVFTSSGYGRVYLDSVVVTQVYDPNYAALQAPGNVAASDVDKTSFTVSWSAVDGATGYEVWLDGALAGSCASTDTSKTLSGLSDGTEYSVQVRALGDGLHFGDSPLSAALSVTTEEDASAVVFAVADAPAGDVYAGDAVAFTVTASVESTGAAAPVVFSGISGAAWDASTGAFSWTPSESDVGSHVAAFTSGEYSTSVAITVVSATKSETAAAENFSKISSSSWTSIYGYAKSIDGDTGTWTGVDLIKTKSAIIIGRAASAGSVRSPDVELKSGALGLSVSFETGALPDMADDKTASLRVSILDAATGTALKTETFAELPKLASDATAVADAGASFTVAVPSGTALPGSVAVLFESLDGDALSGRVYVDTVSFVQTVSAKIRDLAVPAGLALAGDAGENGFGVTFGAVDGATGYEVRVLDASGETAGTVVVDAETLSATVSGLADDACYTVQVRATGDASKYYASPWSEPLAASTARSPLHPTLDAISWQNEVGDGKLYASTANTATAGATLDAGAPGVVSGISLVSVSPVQAAAAEGPALSGRTLSWTPAEADAKKTFALAFEITVAPTDGSAQRTWTETAAVAVSALPDLSAPTLALDAGTLDWNLAEFSWNKPFRAVRYELRVWTGSSDPDATGTTWGEDFEAWPDVAPAGWEFDEVAPTNAYKSYAGVHVGFKASGSVTSPAISGAVDSLSFKIRSVSGTDSTLTVCGWNGAAWTELAAYTGDSLPTSATTKTIDGLGGAYSRFRWTFDKAGSNLAFGSVSVTGTGLPTAKIRTVAVADAATTSASAVPYYGATNRAAITAYDAEGNAETSQTVVFEAPDMPQSVRATVMVFR